MEGQSLKNLLKGLKQNSSAAKSGGSIDVYQLEVEILYYICQDQTDLGIAGKIGSSQSKASVYNLRRELSRLFERQSFTLAEACAELQSMVPVVNGKPQFEPWPPPEIEEEPPPAPEPDPQPVPEEFVEPTPTPDEPPQPRVTIIDPDPDLPSEPRVRERGCFNLPAIMGVVILGLAILLFLTVLRSLNLQERIEGFIPEVVERRVEVTRVVQEVVTAPPDPVMVSELVAATVEAIPTPEPEIITVAPVIAQVTVEVTALATVEVPVTVEVTSLPTPTPTETPLPQTITIIEDFDDGEIDPAFEVTGEVLLLNGVVQPLSNEWVQIKIGDDSWRDYTIEYDYILVTFSPRYCGQPQYLKVRDDNRDNRLIYGYGRDCGNWTMVKSGESILLPNSETDGVAHVSVTLEENELIHQFGDTAFTVLNNGLEDGGALESGFIVIEISPSTGIDNLVITRND